jgi:single-stranded DNA-specific DHH superfamily exonuclease
MKPNPCRYCGKDMTNNPWHNIGTCMRNRIEELERDNRKQAALLESKVLDKATEALNKRVVELEAEVRKWKLEVCRWQDTNTEVEAENALLLKDKAASPAVIAGYRDYNTRLKEQLRVRGERMEEMYMSMKLLSIGTHPEAAGMSVICKLFDDNGKVRDEH